MAKLVTSVLLGASLVLASPAVRCGPGDGLGVSLETQKGLLAKLQMAYVFHIARFVTWPHDDGAVRLCLASESALARYARELDGRDLGDGRHLVLELGAIDFAHCDIAFFRNSEPVPAGVAAGTAPLTALTISDRADALRRGFAMQLFLEADAVRIAINADLVARADYHTSSKLLRLARPPP